MATNVVLPRMKKRDAVSVEMIVGKDSVNRASLPDHILGFMLSTDIYSVADLKPGDTTKEMRSFYPEEKSFSVVEFAPSYPGGLNGIYKYLIENVRYPVSAAEDKIQGNVVVKFTINEEGRVVNPKLAKSVDPDLDA